MLKVELLVGHSEPARSEEAQADQEFRYSLAACFCNNQYVGQ